MNAIEVIDLVKSYWYKGKQLKAVNRISFNVKKGEIFGLLGPNGAGKSTTINIISGILLKDSGCVKIFDMDPEHDREKVRNIMNVSSAYYGLHDVLTCYQNLNVYTKLYRVKDAQTRIAELLKMFDIYHLKDKFARDLSTGERTRLSLCKGLINNPKLLLLDEATVGLDPDIAERTRDILLQYQKENNASILFTSHYMFEVEELCDRIAFMSNGKIIKTATSAGIREMIKKQTIEMEFFKSHPEIKKFMMERGLNVIGVDRNVVIFEISDEHSLHELIHALYQNKYFIRDIRINKPTLDDVFIKIARLRK